tara:strand:+ start:231 stop:488 length:258 start_codon:yes stop_codon:yes gene_type:complete
MIDIVGWIGVALGLFVAPPQLIKIIKGGGTRGISLLTYSFLVLAIGCYLVHAIHIADPVFITAQSLNITVNAVILILLIKGRNHG